MKEFDYYIFIDYSENLVGYSIIQRDKVKELLPKIQRFRYYRESRDKKVYLKHIKKTIKREDIKSYFNKIKIKDRRKSIEIFVEVLDFVKKHENCVIFISVDDFEFRNFKKLVSIIDNNKTKIIKESQLKKGSREHQMSLVIDNLLNIKRRKQ